MGAPHTTTRDKSITLCSVGERAVSEAHAVREILPPPERERERESDCRGEEAARGTPKPQSFNRPPAFDALHSARGREKHASIRRAEAQQARKLYVNNPAGASL